MIIKNTERLKIMIILIETGFYTRGKFKNEKSNLGIPKYKYSVDNLIVILSIIGLTSNTRVVEKSDRALLTWV